MVVAIDGPAGAGKSTVARGVARALGFTYLDSGAMYRAAALALLERRALLASGDWVAEGRDIGTGVAPDAPVKVFLTASPEERARRRAAELDADVETVLRDQALRDAQDSTREHSPLQLAPGAVELDTTGLGVDEVVAKVVELVER